MMEHRLLGASGFKVPVLTLGTGTFGGGNEFFKAFGTSDVQEATRLVDICFEADSRCSTLPTCIRTGWLKRS